jgi:tetratricopeptide (TPR) repeat protein
MNELTELTVPTQSLVGLFQRGARPSVVLLLAAAAALAASTVPARGESNPSGAAAQIAAAIPSANLSHTDLPHTDEPHTDLPAKPAAPVPELTPEQVGDLHMAHHRYQAAIEAYHQTAMNSAEIWNKIGIANQQMFILTEAQKSYENSLKLDDKNPEVINNLGTVYYSLKQYSKAEKLYRKALKYSPKSALIYKNLGTAFLAESKLRQGWECFQSALQLDPQVFEGVGHYHIGDPTPSQQLGAMNFYLAKSCLQAGMKERAINYLRLAIDEGFTDRKKILSDHQFDSLAEMPAFQLLLVEHKN